MIQGTTARVSTLLMLVGRCHSPDSAGNGGRSRGMPRSPSMDCIMAVSSPHTNAPAPSLSLRWKEKSEPMMLSPMRPRSSAAFMAIFRRRMASGYSART